MQDGAISTVRRFHRLVTQRAGALEEQFLGRDRPLGQSRVLYEIGPAGTTLRALRARLGLDSGYLSRLVRALEDGGLVELDATSSDERVRQARLTASGLREFAEGERRADALAATLLAPLSDGQRERLVGAMAEVHRLLRRAAVRIERADPAGDEARFAIGRYFEELDVRFEEGFDPSASLPADPADLVPPRGVFLVARVDGEVVAGGAVKRIDPAVATIKRMWVAASMRGLGLGRALLEALEAQARDLGATLVRMETNRALTEAILLYRSAGYTEVPAFNDDPYADHWFEKRIA